MFDPTADAEFFSAIHQEMEERERRHSDRRPYDCVQLLAPFDGEILPQQHEFYHVKCLDLSPSGIAFTTRNPPQWPQMVIALGQAPFTFVVARIVQVVPLEQPGLVKIGCEFQRKL